MKKSKHNADLEPIPTELITTTSSKKWKAQSVQKPKSDREPISKQGRVIAMLQSPNGATIAAMVKATGWQQHSVRGFLAGTVRKRLRLKLSSKKIDGDRVYRVAGSHDARSGADRVARSKP